MIEHLLLALLVGLALAAVRLRDLLGATAVLGAYSLVMALLWCSMNALDVAFTEAAVGAGISTVLMLAAIVRVGRRERGAGYGPMIKPALHTITERDELLQRRGGRPSRLVRASSLLACMVVAAMLVYGAQGMPEVGDPNSPANSNPEVARRYLEKSPNTDANDGHGEVGPANIVTAVLGDYRGYDTMGETVVIFTAALCVALVLRQSRPPRRLPTPPASNATTSEGGDA